MMALPRVSWRSAFLIAAAVIAVAALLLLAMGRTPSYRYGPIRLWSGDARSNQNSQQITDPYTFTHVLHGVGLYVLLWLVARRLPLALRFVIAVALESVWEVFENTDLVIQRYRTATLSLDYYGDSVVNSVTDIVTAALAFVAVARIPRWASVVLVVALEVLLALWIRDNLSLNVLMLLYQIEAIKTWQLGR